MTQEVGNGRVAAAIAEVLQFAEKPAAGEPGISQPPASVTWRDVRPAAAERGYEVRIETPPGEQASTLNWAKSTCDSMVLGFSRLIWARRIARRFSAWSAHRQRRAQKPCRRGGWRPVGSASHLGLPKEWRPRSTTWASQRENCLPSTTRSQANCSCACFSDRFA